MSYITNFSLLDAYLSTRSVLWLDPSDEFSILKDSSNFVQNAYNKSSNSLLKNFKTGGSTSGVTIGSYTNQKGQALKYLSFNGQSFLESQWDYSYDNNTVYAVFKVNQVTNAYQSLIGHKRDWEYRAGGATNFRGFMRYKPLNAAAGAWAEYRHDRTYSLSNYKGPNPINVSQGWHLLSIRFAGGMISFSIDGEVEEFLPTQFNPPTFRRTPNNATKVPSTSLKSTITDDYDSSESYLREANVFHNSRRFIAAQNTKGNEPDISDETYWYPSQLSICANHKQTQKLKADIAEMICIPTTDINPVANYLIKKWDIERA
jgi:hypothetical protein